MSPLELSALSEQVNTTIELISAASVTDNSIAESPNTGKARLAKLLASTPTRNSTNGTVRTPLQDKTRNEAQ